MYEIKLIGVTSEGHNVEVPEFFYDWLNQFSWFLGKEGEPWRFASMDFRPMSDEMAIYEIREKNINNQPLDDEERSFLIRQREQEGQDIIDFNLN